MKKIQFFWNMTPCLLADKSNVSLIDVAMYRNMPKVHFKNMVAKRHL